jgi:hypothetical protein
MEDQEKFGKSSSFAKSGTPTAPLPDVPRPPLPVKAMPRPGSPGKAGSPTGSSGTPDVLKASSTLQQMRMAVHIRELQEREIAQGTRSAALPQVTFNFAPQGTTQSKSAASGRDVTIPGPGDPNFQGRNVAPRIIKEPAERRIKELPGYGTLSRLRVHRQQ